jgi:hypothetical protein
MLWARMTRLTQSSSCPDVIREKWAAAGANKNAKQDVFALYLACDGNVGEMVATETATKTYRHSMADDLEWCTRKQILAMHNDDATIADEIIKHCTNVGLKRRHPDAPGADTLVQYKCTVKSTENRQQVVEQCRSLHWTGVVSGPTAIAMAENIERIMAMTSDVTEPAAVEAKPPDVPPSEGPPSKRAKGKGKAKAKGTPKPKSASEMRQTYISALAAACLEWVTIMSDVKARLLPQSWAKGLCAMLDTELKTFQQLHETVYTSHHMETDLVNLQASYRSQVESARQCVVAGDNMLGAKRKKFPSEPKFPGAAGDAGGTAEQPAGDAGATVEQPSA